MCNVDRHVEISYSGLKEYTCYSAGEISGAKIIIFISFNNSLDIYLFILNKLPDIT